MYQNHIGVQQIERLLENSSDTPIKIFQGTNVSRRLLLYLYYINPA
jgi:hypothetical protein